MTREIPVCKWGAGLAIRLPKDFIEKRGITSNSKVEIKEIDDGLLITGSKNDRPHLTEWLKGYDGGYKGEELYWGEDVGGEICD